MKSYHVIKSFAASAFSCSAHDLDHTLRVLKYAKLIARDLDINMDILIPSIYLHDIARAHVDGEGRKENHAVVGARIARKFLESIEYEPELIEGICHCIGTHNFKNDQKPNTLEAKVLYDADKLDGLGAMGIARLFAMSGRYGSSMYDFHIEDEASSDYVAPNIEFERKQRHLDKLLFLETSRKMAKEKIEFMDEFFIKLKEEARSE